MTEKQPKGFPAKMPSEKPMNRQLSFSMERLYDRWHPLEDRTNELYSNFKYSRITGIGKDRILSEQSQVDQNTQ